MGDRGKGKDKGKDSAKKTTKASKAGLRPHEQRQKDVAIAAPRA